MKGLNISHDTIKVLVENKVGKFQISHIAIFLMIYLLWQRNKGKTNKWDYIKLKSLSMTKETNISPGWCGSEDRVPACQPKGRRFNSQSGHMPGLQARSPVGDAQEAATH